jgi:hypothetical protein
MKPDRNVPRVHRFLQGKTSPQAVLRDRLGRLELVDAASPRAQALPADRMLGVFSPAVSFETFSREVCA